MLSFGVWIVCPIVAFFLIFYLSRFANHFFIPKNLSHNDFLAPSQKLIGLIYGVLLAFVVVFSWQSYTTLKHNIESEAVALLDVWRDAEFLDSEPRKELNKAVINYLQAISDREWPLMIRGEIPSIDASYSGVWSAVGNFDVKTQSKEAFLTNLINELNNVNSFRRERLLAITSSTPTILWIFMISGSAYIILLTGLYRASMRLSIFIALLQTVIFVFSFYLIYSFNHPFQGALALEPTAYRNVLETIITLQKEGLK